jgi:hypothetical protein
MPVIAIAEDVPGTRQASVPRQINHLRLGNRFGGTTSGWMFARHCAAIPENVKVGKALSLPFSGLSFVRAHFHRCLGAWRIGERRVLLVRGTGVPGLWPHRRRCPLAGVPGMDDARPGSEKTRPRCARTQTVFASFSGRTSSMPAASESVRPKPRHTRLLTWRAHLERHPGYLSTCVFVHAGDLPSKKKPACTQAHAGKSARRSRRRLIVT